MRRHLTTAAAAALAGLLPLAAGADAALVLGTADYANLPDLPRGAEAAEAVDGLAALGFDVSVLADGGWQDAGEAIAAFMADVPEAERLVVALSGRFVTDGSRTWYLAADAPAPTLFTLGRPAVSVESVMAVLARNPSRAVLLLGHDPEADAVFDPWLREGVGDLDIPQGVTVLQATPRNVANFLADELSVPRGDLSRLVTANGAIRSDGYLPRGFQFMPAAAPAAPIPEAEPRPEADLAAESALWQGVVALDTVDAYRNYLRAYPQGRYAAQAQQGIAAILDEPNRQARLVEDGLSLSLDQRRAIQRNLALLDFDPRGIDGIFGPGARSAITNWQQQNGFGQTGFLDGEQVARLEAQAARRAAQIEAEAARQRAAAEAADRAFWEESGAGGDEAGLRAYLDRYPRGLFAPGAAERLASVEAARGEAEAADRAAWEDARRVDSTRSYRLYLEAHPQGLFAEEARARRAALQEVEAADPDLDRAAWERARGTNSTRSYRLYLEAFPEGLYAEEARARRAALQEEEAAAATAADRAAWEDARQVDSTRSYRLYLEAYPEGLFAEEAEARRAALQQAEQTAAAAEAAQAAEAALGLNALTARVVEQRLAALGLDAGEVDGEFDGATRDALRSYQQDRGLPASGFLNEPTLVRLLADTLGEALSD